MRQSIVFRSGLLAMFTLLPLLSLWAQKINNAPRQIDYPTSGVTLGNGWESITSVKTYAYCVTFSDQLDDAQDKSLSMHTVTDQYSLANELKISAELEVKALGGSGTTKTTFVHESEIKNEDSNFAVRAFVLNGVHYARPERSTGVLGFTARALQLAKTDPVRFHDECGDSFVSEIYGGAELDALLTVRTNSQKEKDSLNASLNISAPTFSATGSIEQTTEEYRQKDEMRLLFHEEGGSCDSDPEGTCDSPRDGTNNKLPTGKDQLADKINKLPALAKKYPKNFRIGITRYDALPDWPRSRSEWNLTSYEGIAAQYLMYNSMRKQVQDIVDHKGKYILDYGVSGQQLDNVNNQLFEHTRNLSRTAGACIESDGKRCQVDTGDQKPDYEYRILLPVARGSFQADVDLKDAKADADTKRSELDKFQAAYDKAPALQVFLKPQLAAMTVEYQTAAAKLDQLQAAYPGALKAAIAKVWIQDVASLRCKYDTLNPGCIAPVDVNRYVNRINTQPAKPAPPQHVTVTVTVQ
jgi:hypothetical protein